MKRESIESLLEDIRRDLRRVLLDARAIERVVWRIFHRRHKTYPQPVGVSVSVR